MLQNPQRGWNRVKQPGEHRDLQVYLLTHIMHVEEGTASTQLLTYFPKGMKVHVCVCSLSLTSTVTREADVLTAAPQNTSAWTPIQNWKKEAK